MISITHIALATALVASALGAWTDARTGRIPNALTLPLLVVAPVAWAMVDGWSGALGSVVGALVCGVVPWLCFRQGAMGGGDVKILAALGAVLHWRAGLEAELWALMAAAVFGLVLLARRGEVRRALNTCAGLVLRRRVVAMQSDDAASLTSLRFGPFILCGVLAAAWGAL